MRRLMSRTAASLALSGALFATAGAQSGERVSTLADQRGVGLTIYNSDLALVRDRRRLAIPAGESQVALRDVSARVLATNGGVVLRYADRIETSVDGRIVYPDLPADLRDRPTLVTSLTNSLADPQDIELTYLTEGLNWKADYTALLDAGDDRVDLRGLSRRPCSIRVPAGGSTALTYRVRTSV